MSKIILLLLFLLQITLLWSETLYIAVRSDGSTVTGFILEDNPQDYIVIEDLEGEIYVITYSNLISVTPIRKETPEVTDTVEESTEGSVLEEETIFKVLEDSEPDFFSRDNLIAELGNLSLTELSRVDLDEELLLMTSQSIKMETYNYLKKDDALVYSLWNIIPGAGSLMQGDISGALYTISSVVAAIGYNIVKPSSGDDFFFIFNLNGLFAYINGFVSPYRYNNNYNQMVKDKLTL